MLSFFPPFIASLFAAVITTVGIVVISRFKPWAHQYADYFSSFAAGILISVSFLHILPESFTMNPSFGPIGLLFGYLLMHLLNRFVIRYACHHSTLHSTNCTFGLIPALGIGFHSFIDGIIYTITFAVSPFMGILSTTGMILHEFPEGIITYVLLEKGGFNHKTSIWLSWVTAAITTPLGVIVTAPFLHLINQSSLGFLLALSAGNLIYVGATHLLPHVETESRQYSIIALMSGVIMAVLIVICKH